MSPPDVLAHGVGEDTDLPLPLEVVVQASAAAVLVSFAAVALAWRGPRLRAGAAGVALPGPVAAVVGSRLLHRGLALAVLALSAHVVVLALAGPHHDNPAPSVVYVLLWVGLVPASLLLGPVWRVVSPLRPVHAALARALPARAGPEAVPDAVPEAGLWPAAAALLAFVWLELVAPWGAEPRVLGAAVLGYGAVQVALALRHGEGWFERGEGLEVYSALAGRLAPLGRRDDGALVLRSPLDGLAALGPQRGLVAVVAVWWGSTVFDGVAGTRAWSGLERASGAPVLLGSAGLAATCVVVAAVVALLSRRLDVAPSIVPIAAGYTVAHYASLLLVEGQRAVLLLAAPLGLLDGRAVDADVAAPVAVAAVQVAAVLAGHVVAVVVVHDRSLAQAARAGQAPTWAAVADELLLTLVMAGFTVAGLLVLLAP